MANLRQLLLSILSGLFFWVQPLSAQNWAAQSAPYGRPDATIDLRTKEGTQLARGTWRYSDVKILEVDSKGPGPDLKPSGAPIRTYDYEPHAGTANFDDSKWQVLDPATLDARRAGGKVCFNWYRINVTLPEKVGGFAVSGSTVSFEIVIDDYAEIWVNGELPTVLGQSGGQVVKGWNAPNKVILTRNAQAGQKFEIAVFGFNGPVSKSPMNFIWVKSTTLDFYKPGNGSGIGQVETKILREDDALDGIVAPGTKIEKLAGGFLFTEGPVWVEDGGYLLFSDPNNNVIYRWSENDGVSIYRTHSGYTGMDIGEYGQPGSNGLTLDGQGRLTINEHGNHRVTRLEKNGQLTVLADRYDGKRLNSPNDLVYRSDGTLYFTDPPFGLPKFFEDRRKELPFSGVYCLRNGELKLVSKSLSGPNGLAFSPDEKYMYVDNWDDKRKVILRYEVQPDGSLTNETTFFDATAEPGEDAWDGLKVDVNGNVYASGPGGLWILSPAGKHLGTISGPEHPHNMAWGGDDNRTLYLAAQTGLYRIHLNMAGTPTPDRRGAAGK
ncbi:MAG TPA: SMP-30/gluconolactonase/LRE family protein [Candidatus Acidoferrum sp.]|nr:SMP-30/gluconolactonase/LRE family protein [Candidatus Acidoferrum sp.]